MTRLRIYCVLALLAVLAVGFGVAHGASGQGGYPSPGQSTVASGYNPDSQTAGFRTGLNAADTLTTAAILATPEFKIYGRPTMSIGARFSNASQTCKVQIAYVFKDAAGNQTIKGWSSVLTLTGSATQKESAYYEAPDQLADTEGSVTARILLIAAPAAGTVDLWGGTW